MRIPSRLILSLLLVSHGGLAAERNPVSIDVFRQSAENPPLGQFLPEYTEVLIPESSLPETTRRELAKRRFAQLAQYEFAVWSQNGKPIRVDLVSVGISAPNGVFPLAPVERTARLPSKDGPSAPVNLPFPWLTDRADPNDPMTWGLWMTGDYFVQSTPRYGTLGMPSVDGGVLQSLPDSMDLYTVAENSPTEAHIYAAGSPEANARLRSLQPLAATIAEIDASQQQIAEVINLLGNEVHSLGHGWVDPLTGDFLPPNWPKCSDYDCFKSWNVELPKDPK
jgi:hypothetical protein